MCSTRRATSPSAGNLSMSTLQPFPAEEKTTEKLLHATGDLISHGLVDDTSQMDRQDAERVWELLTRHYKYTGSSRAKAILDDWAGYLPKFVKVMPVEYARPCGNSKRHRSTAMA